MPTHLSPAVEKECIKLMKVSIYSFQDYLISEELFQTQNIFLQPETEQSFQKDA